MTSLNSAGIHITLLKLPPDYKDVFIGCLDDPTSAPRWPGCAYSVPLGKIYKPSQTKTARFTERIGLRIEIPQQNILRQCLKRGCESIIEKESFINNLDRGCGDGDCGTTLKSLAKGMYT